MPEDDQTRWIGIRPTNPAENIPTTTRKQAPAISDLQAIKEVNHDLKTANGRNCTVAYSMLGFQVPAGELWIINSIMAQNLTSLCDIELSINLGASYYNLKGFYSVEPDIFCTWNGQIVLKEDERVIMKVLLGGATDDIRLHTFGHKVGVY